MRRGEHGIARAGSGWIESFGYCHRNVTETAATSIQPIGLIANELVTNAAKHGAGKIDVAFRASPDVNRLIVCDEGSGLADDFDPHAATAGLGMRVITTLAKQLQGTLDAGQRADGSGACFTVQFPRSG